MEKCEYGCDNEAKYTFKNGKNVALKHTEAAHIKRQKSESCDEEKTILKKQKIKLEKKVKSESRIEDVHILKEKTFHRNEEKNIRSHVDRTSVSG